MTVEEGTLIEPAQADAEKPTLAKALREYRRKCTAVERADAALSKAQEDRYDAYNGLLNVWKDAGGPTGAGTLWMIEEGDLTVTLTPATQGGLKIEFSEPLKLS